MSLSSAYPAVMPDRHADEPVALPKSHVTRLLHLLMLLVVLHQLFGSLIVERPLPGEEPGFAYVAHEYVGMVGFGAVFLFWAWALVRSRRETPLKKLFPWFSSQGVGAVFGDIRMALSSLARLQPPPLHLPSLASAIHGLGLLTVTWMAVSGTLWFTVLAGSPWRRAVMGSHHLVANLMWAYLIGHVAIAVLHRLAGDDLFARMFWAKPRG